MKKKRRSIILFLALLVAVASFVYLVSYMSKTANTATDGSAAAVGTQIAMAMAMPFMILSGLGALFTAIGWLSNRRGFALAAGILFSVAMILMIPWFMFDVIQAVLCFIAFAAMKK